MINGVYGWYDKVDKIYMPDSMLLARSERAVCRGFLSAFQADKKMNPNEYELCKFGTFDDETGLFQVFETPVKVDPTVVFEKQPDTHGEVVDE